MNISQNKVDDLNLELTLTIGKEDYADRRKKKLNEHRRTAEIKGFRKGMVPMSLVERIYGQSALVDSVNDIIADSLNGFIKENSLKVVGEPLPSEDQPQTEWVNGNDFTFKFDVATTPEVVLDLSKDDRIPYYNIEVKDSAKAEMKENLLKQYGSLEEGQAAGADDFIIVDFEQGDTKVEGTYVAIRNIDEAVRDSFIGIKPGETREINVNETFTNESDRASMLKVKKEDLATLDPMFKMTVKTVKTFVSAPMTQETFDKIFGEGNVKSEEEFDAKVTERLQSEYSQESEFRFTKDAKDYLVKKAAIALPEKFLKRWIFVANDGKFTMEEIEKDFNIFLKDFRWQLIRQYIVREQKIEIKREDLLAEAKKIAALQFAMYGLNDVPQEQLEQYAQSVLGNENEGRRIYERTEEEKVLSYVKGVVTIEKKPVSIEDLQKMNN